MQIDVGTGGRLLRPNSVPRSADQPLVHAYADAAGGWYGLAAGARRLGVVLGRGVLGG